MIAGDHPRQVHSHASRDADVLSSLRVLGQKHVTLLQLEVPNLLKGRGSLHELQSGAYVLVVVDIHVVAKLNADLTVNGLLVDRAEPHFGQVRQASICHAGERDLVAGLRLGVIDPGVGHIRQDFGRHVSIDR